MENYYVFFVNRGQSYHFLVNVHNTTFATLNKLIFNEIKIKVDEQILLCPTGFSPESPKYLIAYKVGSKEVPLFLYQKAGGIDKFVPETKDKVYVGSMVAEASHQAKKVLEYSDPHKLYMELPERAKECLKVASKAMLIFSRSLQEQELLRKGWLALLSNLDDSVAKMQKRTIKFTTLMDKMKALSEKSKTLLINFDDILDQLKKIEISPQLLANSPSPQSSTALNAEPAKITLYEWIGRADSNFFLEDMADLVEDQIQKFIEQNPKNAFSALETVVDSSSSFRNIKGINKRFSQLEHNFSQCDDFHKRLKDIVARICEVVADLDPGKLSKTVKINRQYFVEIFDFFEKIKSSSEIFDDSRLELLLNIRTRLAGFVVQSYDKLTYVHAEMVNYEEKSNGIRLRLDLIEQIKDTPVLYSQAVSEVVRRQMLKAELTTWHTELSEKCSALASEESDMRRRVSKKLERHFLRSLFPGIFEQMPAFFVKAPLPPYDEEIPRIDKEYISMLRHQVPELEQHLKVKLPEVCSKLLHKDARMHPPPLGFTKREESFITKEPMTIAVSQYNFSPANWLSEDGGDPSPAAPTIIMGKSSETMRESQIGAIPIAPSLKQLDLLNSTPTGSSPAKSAPITIPSSPTDRVVSRELRRSISEESGKLSICDNANIDECDPVSEQKFESEDEFEDEAEVEDTDDDETNVELVEPIKNELAVISEALRGIKPQMKICSNKIADDFQPIKEVLSTTLPSQMKKVQEVHRHNIQKNVDQIKDMNSQIEQYEKRISDLDKVVEKLQEEEKTRTEETKRLEEEVKQLREKAQQVEAETFKKLTVEYELMNDRTKCDYEEQLMNKAQEIDELKKELEKKNAELIKQQTSDPFSEDYKKNLVSEIRSEVEKEFKARIELITKAVEQKKDEGFARVKKENEVEIKILSRENESKARKLRLLNEERNKLRRIVESGCDDGAQILQELDDSLEEIVSDLPKEPYTNMSYSRLPLTASMTEMSESVVAISPDIGTSTLTLSSPKNESVRNVRDSQQYEEGKMSMATQTKICLPIMNMMVAIQDVKPGSTVLVIWDERHSAYILFCSSQYRHFVKETSVRKLGLILTDSNMPRRNWILGCATKIDNCAIKKSVNRYNLPIGTVVRRVEVDPVSMDIETDEQSIPGIAFRNAALADMRY